MEEKAKKKVPVFWIIYASLMFLAIVAVGILLNKLYHFLDAYEATRPVHQADKVVESVFYPNNRERLKNYLTNTVTQETESIEDLLDLFYGEMEGKELSYGRYFGHYTDDKPQYILSADKKQLAYFTLKDTVKYDRDYDFKLWELESVTLLQQSKYSYAVTIPETMTLFVNGKEVAKEKATGHKDSDCKVGYLEYADAGFYKEPQIKVVDRVGQEVKLLQDESTGAYYYLLHYAYAPSDTVVTLSGIVFSENQIMEKDIDAGVDFFMIKEVTQKYEEYQSILGDLIYPSFVKYFVDIYVEEEDTTWKNRLGTDSKAIYDAESKTFSSGIVSDDTCKEQLVNLTTEFLKNYALFCSSDVGVTSIRPYFPAKSQYYEKISHLNNFWFQSHTGTSFQNFETKEYVGYGENYAYVHVYFEQKMKFRNTGQWMVYPIDLPVWTVKIEDKWYVGGMDFDNFMKGFTTTE